MEVSTPKMEEKLMIVRKQCSYPSVFLVDTSINPKKYINVSLNEQQNNLRSIMKTARHIDGNGQKDGKAADKMTLRIAR